MTSRYPCVRHPQDIPVLVSVLKDAKDELVVRHEVAQLLIRSNYEGLVDDLIDVLNDPEETSTFRAYCVQYLWQKGRDSRARARQEIVSILRGCLDDRHIQVRREALLALVRVGDPKGRETAVKWLTAEKAEGVRDAAIRCVRELDLREHIPTIRKYVRDPDTVVRIAAMVTLSQWGDEESRPAFEEAAKSDNFRLQRAGKLALRRIREAQAPEPSESTPPGQF